MIATQRRRWSDNDYYFWPFTFAKSKYKSFALVLSSGDKEYPGCSLRLSVFGYTVIVALPNIIPSYREKAYFYVTISDSNIAPKQEWYWKIDKREYGFSLSSCGDAGIDFLQVFYGCHPRDGDSRTQQSWSWFLPWKQWNHVRHSWYGLSGEHCYTEPQPKTRDRIGWDEFHRTYEERKAKEDALPARTFSFTDFDGEQLTATTRIEEMEWHRGTGWFRWLRYFVKPKICRSLDIKFSGETGRRKGSWKGGTLGHGIEMLPGELHESAFRRYCEGEHRGKKRDMKFLGEV